MSAPGGSGSFQGGSEPPHHSGRNPHLPQRPQFTKEEVIVLKECSSESFWYRCLPFGLAMMGGSQYLVNSGVLKPNPKYGALFKNLAALFIGYVCGKVSYQGECRKKILERIPHSNIAQAFSKKGPFSFSQEMTTLPSISTPGDSGLSSSGSKDEMHSSDFDTDKTPSQTPKGLDDSKRPTMDKDGFPLTTQENDEIVARSFKSYDEMRHKNRSDYEKNQSALDQKPWPPQTKFGEHGPSQGRPPWRVQKSDRGGSGKAKNKYGDDLEE